MKKLLIIGMTIGLSLSLKAQIQNTNPPPSGFGDFGNTVIGYFTAFNTNLDVTFRDSKFDIWTGASSMKDGQVPLLNDIGGSFDFFHSKINTNSPVSTALGLDLNTRNSGVAGTLVSVQGGLEFSLIVHDVKLSLYGDGGQYLKGRAGTFGETGIRVKKAIGTHFYMGVVMGIEFGPGAGGNGPGSVTTGSKTAQVLSAIAGATF